jgi:hypothetical protein
MSAQAMGVAFAGEVAFPPLRHKPNLSAFLAIDLSSWTLNP